MCSEATRSTIRSSSRVIATAFGELPEATAPALFTLKVNGIEREFFDYVARGVPFGPDDGTIAPWALVASLPFAPEIVLRAIEHCIHELKLTLLHPYGFKATLIRPFRRNPAVLMAGYRRGITASIKGRSF
jgi:hypothetical protein